MSLIYMDGFDYYDDTEIWGKYDAETPGYDNLIWQTGGRRGGGAYILLTGIGTNWMRKFLPANLSELIIGFAYYPSGNWTTNTIFTLSNVSGYQSYIQVNADGSVQFVGGAGPTVRAISDPSVLQKNIWQFVEFKVKVHDTLGSFEMRVDGSAVMTGENIDTQYRTDGGITYYQWNSNAKDNSTYERMDDFYICDTSGEFNNDFLGDISIETIRPSAPGNYSQFIPSGEVNNWECVDETTYDTTTWNFASGEAKDSYIYSSIDPTSGETILGIKLSYGARKYDAGFVESRGFSRQSSTDYFLSGEMLSDSDLFGNGIWERNPADGQAWELTDLNSGEFGVELVGIT